ncbi:ECF transporter S component [Facklamia languida]
MDKNSKNYRLVLAAIFAALTALVTMIIKIPIPNGAGYLNLGDGVLMVSGLLFGPWVGACVGGIGSAIADLLSGYAAYAPFTLVVKGLEGFLAAYLLRKFSNRWPGLIIAGLAMALGYFLTDWILYQYPAAIASLPMNIGQGLFGALVAGILYPILRKVIHQD